MLKRNVIIAAVSLSFLTAVGATQNSKTSSASGHSTSTSSNAALKPLTPKSAMTAGHKSSATLPGENSTHKTSTDLARIEHENVKATNSQKASSGPSKATVKPVQTTKNSGSGINASYQKPKVARR
jgi:hypothetical protein